MRRLLSTCGFWLVCGLVFAEANALGAAVVVDNDDGSPGYTETGAWSASGSSGFDGGGYRFANSGSAATATWTATLDAAGDYEVFVWYRPGTNRAPNATFKVAASDGEHTVSIDQSAGGYVFESIGTFHFNAGANTVTLDASASSPGTVVIADAVRFGDDGGGQIDPPVIETVAPGVRHLTYTLPTPQVIHVLEFDLADPQYTIEMGFPHKKRNYGTSRETVSTIASRYDSANHNIVGAINAAFFDYGSIWVGGMLGTRGNVVQPPPGSGIRDTYMLQNNGVGWGWQDLPAAATKARFADGAEMTVGAYNYTCASNTLAVYTNDWAPSTETTSQGVEVIVEDVNYPIRANKRVEGVITAVQTGASSVNNPIPAGGLVIRACSGAEAALLSHASVGDLVEVEVSFTPEIVNNGMMFTGGNGYLVRNGEPFEDGGWYPGFWDERHPRSVLAWNGTKHYFVAFDGRQTGYAVGMSFPEMAEFLIDALDVSDAINLDGGGSTALIIDDEVANCPSDGASSPCGGGERAVANALMLVQRPTTSELPHRDDFSADGRDLAWDEKFAFNAIAPVPASSAAVEGADGFAMNLRNPDGGLETASVGVTGDVNYIVETAVYCDYRPELAGNGFDRVGVFARDDGNGAFDETALGGGNCYALTYDSNDGRVCAGVMVNGVITDFREANPLYLQSDAWRQLRISCYGDRIRFFVDGQEVVDVEDSTFTCGRSGVAYHEYFNDNQNAAGGWFEYFRAYVIPFDFNKDGVLDNRDLGPFIFCLSSSGPNDPYSGQACATEDADFDGDIDLADFALMQYWFGATD